MQDQAWESAGCLLIRERIGEYSGQPGGQVPVVRHERSGQRGVGFKVVAKALGEVLDSFGVSGTLRVPRSPGKRVPAPHGNVGRLLAACMVVACDRAARLVLGFYYLQHPLKERAVRLIRHSSTVCAESAWTEFSHPVHPRG
jgi:hypothetical protein